MSLNYTPLRHRMLAEVFVAAGVSGPSLFCSNQRRSIWRPCWFTDEGVEVRYSTAESRAVTELFDAGLLSTPDWQGDLDVYRVLRVTELGCTEYWRWISQYGEPSP